MWGINFEVFDNGFLKMEKNCLLVKIRSKDGYLDKIFVINWNIFIFVKIIFVIKKFFWNYEKYCLVLVIYISLKIKVCFFVMDFYKLELMC